MPDLYTVTNPDGANEGTVMHPWKGYSGRYDQGEQIPVYQTYTNVINLTTYVWGRITEKPDQFGRHKYVCLMVNNNPKCEKDQVETESWQQAIDAWARTQGYTGPRP